jgi:hypothetical protein
MILKQSYIQGGCQMSKISRIISITVLVLLTSAAMAQQSGLIGKPAPPINAKEWINGTEKLTLEDFKGKIIFLEFTATW